MDDEQKERERLASGGVSQCVEAAGFHGSRPGWDQASFSY